jgi:hypothetical protein
MMAQNLLRVKGDSQWLRKGECGPFLVVRTGNLDFKILQRSHVENADSQNAFPINRTGQGNFIILNFGVT